MKNMMKIIVCAIATFFCLSTNAAFEKLAAGSALPFAFIGDSVFFPFQFMGHSSKYLIARGYGVENYTRGAWGYTHTVHQAKPIALIYYIPGYCLYPFSPLANFNYYETTDACVKILSYQTPHGGYRRQRRRY